MKLDTNDLLRLAKILETKAKTADAKAHEHAQAREMAESDKESRRAESGRYFAEVCKEAHRRLTVRAKRQTFTPPSWEDVLEYTTARHPQWPREDVLRWFNHFESNGWKVSGKAQMVNWQRGCDNGFSNWIEKHPEVKRQAGPVKNPRTAPDPDGWPEFLKSLGRAYKEYRFEQEWVRTDFNSSRRRK